MDTNRRLLLIGIVLLLFGGAGIMTLPLIQGSTSHHIVNRVRHGDLPNLSSVLELYREKEDRYPEALRDLVGEDDQTRYVRKIPKDPWGTDYLYRRSENRFDLYSAGANGKDEKKLGDNVVSGDSKRFDCQTYSVDCKRELREISVWFVLGATALGLLITLASAFTWLVSRVRS